jgi:hypothetical protein
VKKITFNNCLKNMETKELYFKETTGEVIAFKGFEEFSFALCKEERGLWKVIETSVGVGISFGETKADAKKTSRNQTEAIWGREVQEWNRESKEGYRTIRRKGAET